MVCETAQNTADLPELTMLSAMPATRQVVSGVLAAWPDHLAYLKKGFGARSPEQLETTEILATAALAIEGERLEELAQNYRWTCDRLREEELHFHRHGAYRLTTFADADAEVYSNPDYMSRYVDGLLLSQVLWFNHVASCSFYFREAPALLKPRPRFLEIGPGHGLMTYLAIKHFAPARAVAWDISAVSIEHTRQALQKLSVTEVECAVRDATTISPGEEEFDLVVLSEVLEHIEDPHVVLRNLRGLIAEDGLIFVNVPINSPSPDHIYLMETPDEARDLLRKNGFEIVLEDMFATQGVSIERALRNKVSVSVNMFARPA